MVEISEKMLFISILAWENHICSQSLYGFDRLQSKTTSLFHLFWWLVGYTLFTYAGPLKDVLTSIPKSNLLHVTTAVIYM